MTNLRKRSMEAAERYLSRRGYDILETDWQCAAGTVDVIAKDEGSLVFAQVSCRRGAEKGFPSERIASTSRAKREMMALSYLSTHEVVDVTVRFDQLSLVVVDESRAMIRHHINCFSPSEDALAEAA